MDRITLRGIGAYGRHGADAGERERRQPFAIDLSVEIDLSAAARSDDLSQTLDYASLHERIVRAVGAESHALLERLADSLLEIVFEDPRVAGAEITIGKPGILGGATPSITLARRNPRRERP